MRHIRQVVTGIGKHSAGGMPRIQPAVKNALHSRGLAFWTPKDNPGVIELLIPGHVQLRSCSPH